jgi:hypothetical protein
MGRGTFSFGDMHVRHPWLVIGHEVQWQNLILSFWNPSSNKHLGETNSMFANHGTMYIVKIHVSVIVDRRDKRLADSTTFYR